MRKGIFVHIKTTYLLTLFLIPIHFGVFFKLDEKPELIGTIKYIVNLDNVLEFYEPRQIESYTKVTLNVIIGLTYFVGKHRS